MKYDGFYYSVRAYVTFTEEDLGILCEVAEHHYDGRCRREAREGFLRSWSAQCGVRDEKQIQLVVSFAQLDIVLKMLEMAHPVLASAERRTKARVMSSAIHGVLTSLNAEHTRLNLSEEPEDA